jgi:hypothetical protein
MKKIVIKKTEDEFWNRVSEALNSEQGIVHEQELRDEVVHYNANFPKYGGFFLGIPEAVVTIVE